MVIINSNYAPEEPKEDDYDDEEFFDEVLADDLRHKNF